MGDASIQRGVPELVRLVAQLKTAAPGEHVTPDGPRIGTIGDVIAADRSGLTWAKNSAEGVEAPPADHHPVEIRSSPQAPARFLLRDLKPNRKRHDLHLLALKLAPRTGHAETVFHGPASLVLEHCGPRQTSGQRAIGETKLRRLQSHVPADQRLPQIT